MALLEKHENDVRKVAKDVLEDLCPFDLSDEDAARRRDWARRTDQLATATACYDCTYRASQKKFPTKYCWSPKKSQPKLSAVAQNKLFLFDGGTAEGSWETWLSREDWSARHRNNCIFYYYIMIVPTERFKNSS